jgi:hypothetical protein
MEQSSVALENTRSPAHSPEVVQLAQKRQIQALKRVLIAKAEVRRLRSLIGRRRITAR